MRAARSGKVGLRERDRPPFTKDEKRELVQLLAEALREVVMMHSLAYGSRVNEARREDERVAAQSREKAQNEAVGPPTPEAWGEVPSDLAGRILMNRQYRWAYGQMVDRVLRARVLLSEAATFADRVVPEATTDGSPLPDMRRDNKAGGAREYAGLVEAQKRRVRRGEL